MMDTGPAATTRPAVAGAGRVEVPDRESRAAEARRHRVPGGLENQPRLLLRLARARQLTAAFEGARA
ncbi:hypothetical protein ACWD5F_25145 [Streptomyces sp. NPDC002499]